MPPTPETPTSDQDQEVRSFLKTLGDYDRAVIACTLPLERLFGNDDSPGTEDLLDLYIFTVCDVCYAATMTKEHYTYLMGFTSDLSVFAKAIFKLLAWMDRQIAAAMTRLDEALGSKITKPRKASKANPPNVAKPADTIPVPTIGCCTISPTDQEDTTESLCHLKHGGTWNCKPCSSKDKG